MPTFTKEQYEELEKMDCIHQLSEEETRTLADEIDRDIIERLEGAVGELIRNSRVVVDEENGVIICDKLFPPYDRIII